MRAARSGDAQLVHDLGSLGLAIARQGLDEGGDLQALGDGIVRGENALDGLGAGLDIVAKLGAGMTGHSGLLEGGLALLIRKDR